MTVVVGAPAESAVARNETSVVVTRQGGETAVVRQAASTSAFVVRGVPGPAGPSGVGEAGISADPGNRATSGTDGGVYVRDDLVPDPLAYYILAKA